MSNLIFLFKGNKSRIVTYFDINYTFRQKFKVSF